MMDAPDPDASRAGAAGQFARTQVHGWEVSDPARSAWVVANAGSGKTYVLTQRVLRLLLAGADPASVLCLTFTKVAAAEMARRIFGELGRWTTLPEPELRAKIGSLQGFAPDGRALVAARRLFARALETPGGLKIQTIHAFCERLLHQFPFEANVPGQFAILDDTSAAALLAGARGEAMMAAAIDPDGRIGTAIRHLAEHATDGQIAEGLDAVIARRELIRRWIERAAADGETGSVDDAIADLRARLGLSPGETEASVCRDICQAVGWGREDCGTVVATIADALSAVPHQTNERARLRAAAIPASSGDSAEAEARLEFFLQADKAGWRAYEESHRYKAHRFGADFGRANADLIARFEAESARLLTLTAKLRAARNLAATEALLVVGDAILQAYHAAKRRAGQLDFSDLIMKARNLLSRADAAAWVLYKLDARIDHILVDEAQDTSPDQWAVVQALAGDFFAGDTRERGPRTVFAVGDDKQSIFGFQGGAPHMLADMARFFAAAARGVDDDLVQRPLFLSFRSTQEVLSAVDQVFSGDLAARVTASTWEAHAARRHAEPGRVVLLPRVLRQSAPDPEAWTEPFDAPSHAEETLAAAIVSEIVRLIGTTLPSGKQVRAGSVLILVRKRGALVAAVNRALREAKIPAAGADRIPVATHIAVLDMLALADVMLLPDDDLQLAACLKSPLIGLDEVALMLLAAERGPVSLWRRLMEAEEAPFRAAAEKLRRWRGFADQVTPFRFFATLLGPDGGRRAFAERLGGEADEVLDALLGRALAYEAIEPPSLQGFLRYLRASQGDIKRDAESAASGVRVMTVHGAKGLEADVVFVVDDGGRIVVHQHRDTLVAIGDDALLWRRSGADATEAQAAADALGDRRTQEEYLRLLYVAMTRASDFLYVCGIRPAKAEVEGCWYGRVATALLPKDAARDPETGELAAAFEWPQPARAPVLARPATVPEMEAAAVPPEWLARPAPAPPPAPQPLRPSRALAEPDFRVEGEPGEAASPGAASALRRGRLLHRLLQGLPDLPPGDRAASAARLAQRVAVGDADPAGDMEAEILAVLAHPGLANLFGPGSRAEVPVVGELETATGAYAVSGQIDRLLRDGSGWRIADFKTARAPPSSIEAAPPAAVLQLALYRRLLMEMEPGVPVSATLVWTAGPTVMPVPEALMEKALARIGIHPLVVP